MILNIDLHTHTSRYSPCSILSPEALCKTAIARGLNAIAITEHHYQWSEKEIARLEAKFPSIKLYAGVEISCTDDRDYVALGLDPGTHYTGSMSSDRLQALIDTHPGAFTFVAHCFRHNDNQKELAERRIDGIEMASYNILARPQLASGPIQLVRANLYQQWQARMNWIPLYNSDGHSGGMIGTFYNQIETPDGLPGDETSLIRLLRGSEIRGIQNDALIRAATNRA
jgi:hypothetical protein